MPVASPSPIDRPPGSSGYLPQIGVLKAVASQLIVWHHLAFYGPMAGQAKALWPGFFDGLSRHGRLAVTVFLVVGGFLAARSLAPHSRLQGGRSFWPVVVERYTRLVGPFAVMLMIAIVANLIAGRWMDHHSVSPVQGADQVLAHLLLVQDLLGFDALSAGVWYVAIDFQLFVLLTAVLSLARWGETRTWTSSAQAPMLVALLAAASLFSFNRMPALDATAFYFFATYALGALVAWWAPSARHRAWLLVVALTVVLGVWVDWRLRIAVAAAVAVCLAVAVMRGERVSSAWSAGWLQSLGRISYSLFLVHFPVCLVVNAVFTRWASADPWVQTFGMVVAWMCSLAAAMLFYRLVERPMMAAVHPWRAEPRVASVGLGLR